MKIFALFLLLALAAPSAHADEAPLDPTALDHAHWFDFLVGDWTYAFGSGSGTATYDRVDQERAVREQVNGTINGRAFYGTALRFPNDDGTTWTSRWIDTMGNTLQGTIGVEDYDAADGPALVSRFEHAGVQMMHVWYGIQEDRFETDLAISQDDGETWTVIRRMPYLRALTD